jgi:hypothetical protein
MNRLSQIVVLISLSVLLIGRASSQVETEQAAQARQTSTAAVQAPTDMPPPTAMPTVPSPTMAPEVRETATPSPAPVPSVTSVVVSTTGNVRRIPAAGSRALLDNSMAVLRNTRIANEYRTRPATGAVGMMR